MSTINNGGPAFPAGSIRKSRSAADPGADFVVTDVVAPKYAGMTLRDYFAAKALVGLMGRGWSSHKGPDYDLVKIWAESSFGIADAMLAAREGSKQ